MTTVAQAEEARRQLIFNAPMYAAISPHMHARLYGEIITRIWRAWDRTGHTGSPDGSDPRCFLITPQRGKGRMLWFLGEDNWFRDCSWRQPSKSKSDPLYRLRDACRDAVQATIDRFAQKHGRNAQYEDVDHTPPLADLVDAWWATLSEFDRKCTMATIASPPGLSFDGAVAVGMHGDGQGSIGRPTGKCAWIAGAGDRWRRSWVEYHDRHATLRVVSRLDNARKGRSNMIIHGRGGESDPTGWGPDLPDLDL